MTPAITLISPLNYQVIQRRSPHDGILAIAGCCQLPSAHIEVRLSGNTRHGAPLPMRWQPVDREAVSGCFQLDLVVPAGGWYALEVRARTEGTTVASVRVAHVGVGEVFVGAGQSNSTSCGGVGSANRLDGRTKSLTRRVSTFDGSQWRIADDPQPGAHDTHSRGSFWPAFGDAMATRYQVPIGVAVTGHAGTSIRQWTRNDTLFHWTLTRLRQLGVEGFRALLWHQGENDADTGMSTAQYSDGLADIIQAWRADLGRDFPFFVAQASFIPWLQNCISPEIRAAQRLLDERGIALPGPDTDAMRGELRDCGGKGIHFSKMGLKVHGEAWAEKVAAWLDPILNHQASPAGSPPVTEEKE